MPNRVSCSLGEPDPEAPGGLSVFQLLSSGRWALTQWGIAPQGLCTCDALGLVCPDPPHSLIQQIQLLV